MKENVSNLLINWGLQDSTIKHIHDTIWQVGEAYVLKVYQNPAMLERNLKILGILEKMDIPVGKAVPAFDGRRYVESGGMFYFLSERLPGSSIVRIGNVRDTAQAMGEIIARLHEAFQKCGEVEGLWDNSLLKEMNGWVKENFANSGWQNVGREEYEEIVSHLEVVYGDLPVQLIHRDVHFGNFLFTEGAFSGYIDFDLSQKNIRIFDLCYFLTGLLTEQEKLGITREQWFEFVKNTFEGYESRLKLSETEKRAVPCVMECIELLFVSWFEGNGDRSGAEDACKVFRFVREQESRVC